MKKFLIGLTVVVFAVLAALYFGLNMMIKTGIESYAPKVLGADVRVGSSSVSIFSGTGSLRQVTIGNPHGFDAPYAMKLGRIHVKIDPRSLFSDVIRVQEIIVDQPDLYYEVSTQGSNINALKKQTQLNTPKTSTTTQQKTRKKMVIDYLKISEGTLRPALSGLEGAETVVRLPGIEMKNLGSKNPQLAGNVIEQVFEVVASRVATTASRTHFQSAAKELGQGLNAAKDSLMSVFE